MKLTLVRKKDEVPDVVTFEFTPEVPINWKAGQFMKYHIEDPSPDERRMDRYFTISSAPFEQLIKISSKFVPDDGSTFKKDLRKLSLGDSIQAIGPSGDFVVNDPSKNYVFIAGGIGITPFRSILLDLNYRKLPINITLLYANKTPDFVFKEELENIQKNNPIFKIHYFIDPKRIDEQAIRSLISDIRSPIYYVSGPEPMVEAMEAMLYKIGVPKENVQRDYFPGYKWP